jgi:hypothetical protein
MPFWNLYLIWVVLVPSILLMIVSFWFVRESPEFLVGRGRDIGNCRQVIAVIEEISRYNNIS